MEGAGPLVGGSHLSSMGFEACAFCQQLVVDRREKLAQPFDVAAILGKLPGQFWIAPSCGGRFCSQFLAGTQQFREECGHVLWSCQNWPSMFGTHAVKPKAQAVVGVAHVLQDRGHYAFQFPMGIASGVMACAASAGSAGCGWGACASRAS